MPTPYLLLAAFIFAYIVLAFRSQRSSLRLNQRTWEQLVAGLEAVDAEGIGIVARDYLNPRRGQIELEPTTMWTLLGGDEGLRRMRANASNMIALAAFAQHWNMEESVVVAERMRRDGVRLRRAIARVQLGMAARLVMGHHLVSVPFQLQEAASAYYLMRQRLLALYETSHIGLHPALARAL